MARLTDKQLVDLYAHPRDKDGSIKVPEEANAAAAATTPEGSSPSLERDLRDLTVLAGMLRMTPEAYKAAEEKLRAKWAARARPNRPETGATGGSPNG